MLWPALAQRHQGINNMFLEQIIALAVIQGITEFLPISSSGHLILVPALTGWKDQGLIVDVMVHMGSFLAVITYFWRDVLALTIGGLNLLRGRMTDHGRLGLLIIVATIPAVVFGLYVKKTGVIDAVRGPEIVAWNAIIFGVLMYFADRFGKHTKVMENMTFMPALLIGMAQAVAIIPGTSRSGITMTAARFLGFQRPEAARFSFLVGIPAIAGAGVLVLGEAIADDVAISGDAVITGVLTFFTALAAIWFLMAVVKRYSLTSFVIYRLLLGAGLLYLVHTGFFAAAGQP